MSKRNISKPQNAVLAIGLKNAFCFVLIFTSSHSSLKALRIFLVTLVM